MNKLFSTIKIFLGSHSTQEQLPVFQKLPLTFSNSVTTPGTKGAELPKIPYWFCNVNTSNNFEKTRAETHKKKKIHTEEQKPFTRFCLTGGETVCLSLWEAETLNVHSCTHICIVSNGG